MCAYEYDGTHVIDASRDGRIMGTIFSSGEERINITLRDIACQTISDIATRNIGTQTTSDNSSRKRSKPRYKFIVLLSLASLTLYLLLCCTRSV